MSQDDVMRAIDEAAKQPDRWWVVAMFTVLLAVFVIIWRFMVADREKLGARLTKVTDEHIAVCKSVTEVVANNTQVLREVREVINDCRYRDNLKHERS